MSTESTPKALQILEKRFIGKQVGYALAEFDCTGCGRIISMRQFRFKKIVETVDGGAPKCVDCHPKEYTECIECEEPILVEPDRLCPRCNRCWNAHMGLGSGNRGNE